MKKEISQEVWDCIDRQFQEYGKNAVDSMFVVDFLKAIEDYPQVGMSQETRNSCNCFIQNVLDKINDECEYKVSGFDIVRVIPYIKRKMVELSGSENCVKGECNEKM